MPTIFLFGPYRFFFYAGDKNEPIHIHVERENKSAKFWLEPIRLAKSQGFSREELRRIQNTIEEYQEQFIKKWNEYFND
jgi:hypothetical protein